MTHRILGSLLAVLVLAPAAFAQPTPAWLSGKLSWVSTGPLIAPANRPEDPVASIKDPTIIFDNNRWHIYATIRAKSLTKMEYLSFADWKDADAAPRQVITLVDAYHCAPQAFYFRPQKKWYLVYQWNDKQRKAFGPCFSIIDDISKPATLTKPEMMYPEKPKNLKGWLDFWVICDEANAHLFFTSLDGKMWRAQTAIKDFPKGWDEPKIVLQGDIFEASHTYRLKGMNKYLTIIEAQASQTRRYYKAYLADTLDGKWTPLADSFDKPFAGASNVKFGEGVQPWTDSISHGELIRDGNDETMTVDPANLQFLYQGCDVKERQGKGYGQYPWRLGLLKLEVAKE